MSATLMSEAEALTQYLRLHARAKDAAFFSGFTHALREARKATARNPESGQKLPGSEGQHGSWLGAVGYFALLDQIGASVKPRRVARVNGNCITQALTQFSTLRSAEIDALYALRCAFAHDYSLINVGSKPSLTHVFFVYQGAAPTVVSLPATGWNGDLATVDQSVQTAVNLEAFGDLVEGIVTKLQGYAASDLEILLPGGPDELVRRYMFSADVSLEGGAGRPKDPTEIVPLPLDPEQKFQALCMRYQDHVELLRTMSGLDVRLFSGLLTIQLGLGSWFAAKPMEAWPPLVGLLVLDAVLCVIGAVLLRNNAKRRVEAVSTLKNVMATLGFYETGFYADGIRINAAGRIRLWGPWYIVAILVAYLGFLIVATTAKL